MLFVTENKELVITNEKTIDGRVPIERTPYMTTGFYLDFEKIARFNADMKDLFLRNKEKAKDAFDQMSLFRIDMLIPPEELTPVISKYFPDYNPDENRELRIKLCFEYKSKLTHPLVVDKFQKLIFETIIVVVRQGPLKTDRSSPGTGMQIHFSSLADYANSRDGQIVNVYTEHFCANDNCLIDPILYVTIADLLNGGPGTGASIAYAVERVIANFDNKGEMTYYADSRE